MKILKRLLIIFLILIILVAVAASGLYIWQKDNIDSFIMSIRMNDEEISQKLSSVTEKLDSEMTEVGLVRELTKEEVEKIKSGEVTAEQMVETLLEEKKADASQKDSSDNQTTSDKTPSGSNTTTGKTDTKKPEKSDKSATVGSASGSSNTQRENIINKYVAQLYVLEAQYEGELAAFVSSIRAEFYSYPLDQRNGLLRDTVIASNIGRVSQMESECDAKVNAIMAGLTSELKAIGSDTAVVKTLRDTYNNKKSLKKAQYMQEYNN